MNPDDFIAEVYRRMAARMPGGPARLSLREFEALDVPKAREALYARLLPKDKESTIVEVGSGDGWFLKLCNRLGYTNVTAVDFRAREKFSEVCGALPSIRAENLNGSIGEHFGVRPGACDFFHLSHVIEHIPKYGLLYAIDAIYRTLKPNGRILVRTPNMEGPFALSCYYVTLAHEYGFVGSNLWSILHLCGFDEAEFYSEGPNNIRERVGIALRAPYLAAARIRNRLFGVNLGGQFGSELIASAVKRDHPGFFDERFR